MAIRRAIFVVAASMTLGAPAYAAEPQLADAPEVKISSVRDSGSFYLRADIGYTAARDVDDALFRQPGIATLGFDDARFGHPLSGTVGFGGRITDVFRADITAEYFNGRYDGTSAFDAGIAAAASPPQRRSLGFDALGLMANIYADLGTVAGFTPYAGAGLGATYLDWGDMRTSTGGVSTTLSNDAGGWRVTYALMAGVAYDLTDRLTLDAGYRYSDIAGGTFFSGGGVTGSDDGLSRHEIRAGLRLSLW